MIRYITNNLKFSSDYANYWMQNKSKLSIDEGSSFNKAKNVGHYLSNERDGHTKYAWCILLKTTFRIL